MVQLLCCLLTFLAYYVSYNNVDISKYVLVFFTTEKWPVGPPWFIWVLFVFNVLFVFINPIIKKLNIKINRLFDYFQTRPILLFLVLMVVTWIIYVPIAYNVGAATWIGWFPFDSQISRILLYFGYFMIGVLIGNTDFNNKLFSKNSVLVTKWWIWILLSLGIYLLLTICSPHLLEMVENNLLKEFNAWMIYFTIYVISCTSSCLAFITAFRKFANNKFIWWNSLSNNAYLIYMAHYIFVIWIQFFLMNYKVPAFLKFVITFVSSLILSWIISCLLRKIKLIKRYL